MSSATIRVLDASLINQIAAGEVIESPASVVKELLDNSLDAGARKIEIEFRAGGRQLIRVSDDGIGMSEPDSVLCFTRHATSKIGAIGDLERLSSCGFRGEALAAIAAISKVRLVSSDGAICRCVEIAGGQVTHSGPASRSRGTTVEVTALFFNAPVRREYQASIPRDQAAIIATLSQIALAHPTVSFRLIRSGVEVFHLPACASENSGEGLARSGDYLLRAQALLGRAFVEQLAPFAQVSGPARLWGYLASPLADRPNRLGQYVYVNQRPIHSPAIGAAVARGYGARLSQRRFPGFILHALLPPGEVDFNVHPQKREVRLKDPAKLLHWISGAVDRHFLRGYRSEIGAAAPLPWDEEDPKAASDLKPSEGARAPRDDLPPDLKLVEAQPLLRVQAAAVPIPAVEELSPPPLGDFDSAIWQNLLIAIWEPYLLFDLSALKTATRNWWQLGPPGSWLVVDYAKASAWAHARGVSAARSPARQLLMHPLVLSLSASDVDILFNRFEELETWGLSLTRTGRCDIACLAIPQTLKLEARELAEALQQLARIEEPPARSRWLERWLSQRDWLCSPKLSSEIAWKLLRRLLASSAPPRTARGEAIAALFTREDLARHLRARG